MKNELQHRYIRSIICKSPDKETIRRMLEKANLNSKTESNRMQEPKVNNW